MIARSIIEGLIWSVMWIIFVYIIIRFFPWGMVHDYPKDIQDKSTLPEPTDGQKRNAKVFSVIASLVIFGALFLFGLIEFKNGPISFMTVFVYILIIAMTWNVIDLILMDWIFECSITPSWMVLPGTEGCEGYKDYLFHFKGFLVGCVYSVIMTLVVSGIIYGILRLMGVH